MLGIDRKRTMLIPLIFMEWKIFDLKGYDVNKICPREKK